MYGARRDDSGTPRPFIGRADLVTAVDGLLARAAERKGGGILVVGPGGVGKSEVLRSACGRARERGFRVAIGRAMPDELPAPFSLLRELTGSLANDAEPVRDAEAPAFLVPFLDETPLGPRPSEAQRPAAGTDELERILAPLGQSPVEGLSAGRDRYFVRLTEYVIGLARGRPLLLAIDDLPFADPSSLEFLRRLADELTTAPLAVVATTVPEAEVPEAVRDLVTALGRSPAFATVAVRPFSIAELTEFVTWIQHGTPPTPADAERWLAQTDGNPLFVEQLVRAALEGGSREIPLGERPPDLVTVLLGRIRALDDTERRVLTYAAILGREFDFPRLKLVAGLEEERLTEALDRLVLAGLLRERGDEVYEFVSEAVRGSVYSELTETRRRILHRRVGAALESHGVTNAFELGRQFYLGGELPKTVEYNVRAAEAAARSFAFDAAISHLARALEAERKRPDRDPRREIRLLTEYGRLLQETGDLVPAEEAIGRAVELARTNATFELELGRALIAHAWTRADGGLYPAAEALATEATAILERVGTPRDLLSAHRVLGNVYWRVADRPRAEAHQRVALEIAGREGSPIELGHALVDVANTLVPRGPDWPDNTLTLYSRAAELFATAGDPLAQARALMDRGVVEYWAGRVPDAFRDLHEALAAAERARSPFWIGFCCLNIAQWQAEQGDAKAAELSLEKGAQALRPLANRFAMQQAAMTRGVVAQAAGRLDEADAQYEEALQRAREMDLRSEIPEVMLRRAELCLLRGDRPGASRWLEEARASGLVDQRPDLGPRADKLGAAVEATA